MLAAASPACSLDRCMRTGTSRPRCCRRPDEFSVSPRPALPASRLPLAGWRSLRLTSTPPRRITSGLLPRRCDRVTRARLERCWARHPNRTNPYAWRFFLGADPPGYSAPAVAAERIELVCADAAAYLESCPPASFIGFSLSNILDGTEPAYGERLMAAVRGGAQDGAVVVLRSFLEPPPGESTEWAARDRSMLWGRLTVEKVH